MVEGWLRKSSRVPPQSHDITIAKLPHALLALGKRLEDICRGLGAEAWKGRNSPVLACLLKGDNRAYSLMSHESRQSSLRQVPAIQKGQRSRSGTRRAASRNTQSIRLDERGDLLSDRLADALNLQKTVFNDFWRGLAQCLERSSRIEVARILNRFSPLSSSKRAICSKILAISSLVISSLERARNLF